MAENLKIRVQELLNSQNGKDIKTLLAFTINKTETIQDNEIVENIDQVVDIVAANIEEIAHQKPTEKEAKDAAMRTLKSIAEMTPNKWDDRAIAIIDMFV
jgi:hypothetical protein